MTNNDDTRVPGGDALSRAKAAYIGLSAGMFAFKWGPYPPEKVGQILSALVDAETKHCAFISLDFGNPEDPVDDILAVNAALIAEASHDKQ